MPLPRPRPLALSAAIAASIAVTAFGRPCVADEPVRPPQYDPKAYPPPATQGTMLLAGAATTATWYTLALSSALLWPTAAGADDLRIPVAGPFMALADTGCDSDDPNCSLLWPVIRAILIGIDGVGQVGGLAIMGEAAFLPTAKSDASAETSRARRSKPRDSVYWRPVPLVTGRSGIGVGVIGHF